MPQDVTAAEQGIEISVPWRSFRRTGNHKVAFTIQELIALTSDFSLKHVNDGCQAFSVRTDHKQFLFVYRVRCSESYSDPKGHLVKFKFDFKKMKETHSADDLDVRVSCSCPAFLYWGAQWNLATGDALYGAPRDKFQPPTDPKRYQNVICKHIKVVEERLAPVLDRMLDGHKTKIDKARNDEKQKQVDVVKQQQQLEVDQKTPVPLKTAPVEDEDLESMPDDLSELGLPTTPGGITPASQPPKKKPITRKAPPIPSELIPPPEATPAAPAPSVEEPAPVSHKAPPGKKAPRPIPSNITLVDDDDDSTVILPGAKARRMEEVGKGEKIPPSPRSPIAPKTPARTSAPPPKLPSNITLVDEGDDVDDDDDEIVTLPGRRRSSKRSRRKMLLAALILPPPEV